MMIAKIKINWNKFKNVKFPFVSRKKYLRDLGEQWEKYSKIIDREKAKQEEIAQTVDELLPRLARVDIDRPFDRSAPEPRLFRIIVTFDEFVIQQSFLWGNNKREIDFIAQRLGYEIAKELTGINSSRLIRDMYR